MNTYGYVRVSDAAQHEDRQLIAMSGLNIPPSLIYTDKMSGKDFDCPAYRALTERLVPGDLVYIKNIDRLGRNYDEIQSQWRILTFDPSIMYYTAYQIYMFINFWGDYTFFTF